MIGEEIKDLTPKTKVSNISFMLTYIVILSVAAVASLSFGLFTDKVA